MPFVSCITIFHARVPLSISLSTVSFSLLTGCKTLSYSLLTYCLLFSTPNGKEVLFINFNSDCHCGVEEDEKIKSKVKCVCIQMCLQ